MLTLSLSDWIAKYSNPVDISKLQQALTVQAAELHGRCSNALGYANPSSGSTGRRFDDFTAINIGGLDLNVEGLREINMLDTSRIIDTLNELLESDIVSAAAGSYSGPNTLRFEVLVVLTLMQVWKFPANRDAVGSMITGSTEGVILGVLNAKRALQGNSHNTSLETVVVSGERSHYCGSKAAELQDLRYFKLSSNPDTGAMNMETTDGDLAGEPEHGSFESFVANNNKKYCFIVIITHGTTMEEANEDSALARLILERNGVSSDQCWVHADGAVNGIWGSFNDELSADQQINFKNVDSANVSFHKFCTNIPCGVFVAVKSKGNAGEKISYISTVDTTITGCRNAVAPAVVLCILLLAIPEAIAKAMKRDVKRAEILSQAMHDDEPEREIRYNRSTRTIRFKDCTPKIASKYGLPHDANQVYHLVIMPDVENARLEEFLRDYLAQFSNAIATFHERITNV